jgi:hypothetical protein
VFFGACRGSGVIDGDPAAGGLWMQMYQLEPNITRFCLAPRLDGEDAACSRDMGGK